MFSKSVPILGLEKHNENSGRNIVGKEDPIDLESEKSDYISSRSISGFIIPLRMATYTDPCKYVE